MAQKFKIRKGDKVVVTTGREKGKSGEVIEVIRSEDRVLVQGVNMVTKHVRASQASPGGENPHCPRLWQGSWLTSKES